MFLVDSHCHFDSLDFNKQHQDIDDVMKKAALQDVKYALAVATTQENSHFLQQWLGEREDIFLSCGVHPLNLDEGFNREKLIALALHDRVIAIGEIGLDYYYQKENCLIQQQIFAEQIQIGNLLRKPVIIHTRQAQSDTIASLQSENVRDCGGILHCFTEDVPFAKKILDMGLYISFSGILTFKNAEQIREVARYVPFDRILVETDSPYLAPVPYRGKENHPAFVRAVAEYLAILKGVSFEKMAEITTNNFRELFGVQFN